MPCRSIVVMGLLGWLGLKINMGAAMIAAVSMGLSVDSSLHYFVCLPPGPPRGTERDRGPDRRAANASAWR